MNREFNEVNFKRIVLWQDDEETFTDYGRVLEEGIFKGIITPISWDENDNPLLFSLYNLKTSEDLVLRPTRNPLPLNHLVNKEVLILGKRVADDQLFYRRIILIPKETETNTDNEGPYYNNVLERRFMKVN